MPILDPILRPILRPIISSVKAKRGTSTAFSPSSVPSIMSWWDVSDLTTLFQLSNGTTAVAANDPVGYVADKSGGGFHMLQATGAARPILRGTPTGAELCADGTFSTGAPWNVSAGWAVSGGVMVGTATSTFFDQTLPAVISSIYMITYDVVSVSAGSVQARMGGTTGATRSAVGTYTEWITAVDTTNFRITGTGFTGSIDNVSVKLANAASVAAPYWLEYDFVDDKMATAALTSKVAPLYFIGAVQVNDLKLNSGYMAIYESGTNYIASMNRSTQRMGTDSISSTAGSVFAAGANSEMANYSLRVIESVVTVGATKGKVDNNTEYSSANAWVGGTTLTTPVLAIANFDLSAGASKRFYGGAMVLADPSAGSRASLRTYFGAKQGRAI